jgi:hypothetical protein
MRRQNPGGKELNHAAKQDPTGSCYGTEERSSREKSIHGSAWKKTTDSTTEQEIAVDLSPQTKENSI